MDIREALGIPADEGQSGDWVSFDLLELNRRLRQQAREERLAKIAKQAAERPS